MNIKDTVSIKRHIIWLGSTVEPWIERYLIKGLRTWGERK